MSLTRLGLLLALCVGACSAGDPCLSDASDDAASDDAASDDALDASVRDVGLDASRTRCTGSPPSLAIGAVVRMTSPAEGELYAGTEPEEMRIEIYRHGDTTPIVTRSIRGYADLQFGAVVPGDYDLAITFDGYTVGAALMDDDHCAGRSGPECAPLAMEVRSCETVTVTVALFCDSARQQCATHEW